MALTAGGLSKPPLFGVRIWTRHVFRTYFAPRNWVTNKAGLTESNEKYTPPAIKSKGFIGASNALSFSVSGVYIFYNTPGVVFVATRLVTRNIRRPIKYYGGRPVNFWEKAVINHLPIAHKYTLEYK